MHAMVPWYNAARCFASVSAISLVEAGHLKHLLHSVFPVAIPRQSSCIFASG